MLKKKPILKDGYKKQKHVSKKRSNVRAHLDSLKQRLQPQQPGNGMIHLDPREWGGNGGFGGDELYRGQPGANPNVPPGGFGPGKGMIQLDPREWNGGFGDDSLYRGQPGANPNVPPGGFGPGKGMIQLDPREWNGGFGDDSQLRQAVMPPDYQPGQRPQIIQDPGMREQFSNAINRGRAQFESDLQRRQQSPGMIHLDPRESGGFNRPPMKMPLMPGGSGGQTPIPMPGGMQKQTPMQMPGMQKQTPMQMPGMRKQTPMPMPGLTPPTNHGNQQLRPRPMPNPGRRSFIPKPVDPRMKMF